MTGAPMRAVAVVPDSRRYAERGAELVAQMRAVLGQLACRVEHIGGTSIPGMATKPVYDVQVSVRNLAAAGDAFDAPLTALGLADAPDEAGRVPAGRIDPPQRWAKRLWRRHTGGEWMNLHVRVAGAPNERLALLLRDWFRAHPQAVPAHEDFKQRLANAVASIETYADVKDPVVDLIIVTAEAWADRIGWLP